MKQIIQIVALPLLITSMITAFSSFRNRISVISFLNSDFEKGSL